MSKPGTSGWGTETARQQCWRFTRRAWAAPAVPNHAASKLRQATDSPQIAHLKPQAANSRCASRVYRYWPKAWAASRTCGAQLHGGLCVSGGSRRAMPSEVDEQCSGGWHTGKHKSSMAECCAAQGTRQINTQMPPWLLLAPLASGGWPLMLASIRARGHWICRGGQHLQQGQPQGRKGSENLPPISPLLLRLLDPTQPQHLRPPTSPYPSILTTHPPPAARPQQRTRMLLSGTM